MWLMCCIIGKERESRKGKKDERVSWREEPQDMAVIEFIDQTEKEEGSRKNKYINMGHTVT